MTNVHDFIEFSIAIFFEYNVKCQRIVPPEYSLRTKPEFM